MRKRQDIIVHMSEMRDDLGINIFQIRKREAVVTGDPRSGAIIANSPLRGEKSFSKIADEDTGLFITI